MGLEFRRREYGAEKQSHSSLPRGPAHTHPLSDSHPPPVDDQFKDDDKDDFSDPLRNHDQITHDQITSPPHPSFSTSHTQFNRLLMQRFPLSKNSMASGVFVKGSKEYEKSSRDLRSAELDHHQMGQHVRLITQEEYVSQLHQLREEIRRSWQAGDRVTSLRLSVKVAKLLMDTSAVQFYPTLFVQATDIMDMLGDLVWSRIKQKAELPESGLAVCSLPDNFKAADICFDAKETCNNWFRKIGSVCELLPRIYLELAILRCWSFLLDDHKDILHRLVLMIRGIGNPLASAYCCLYMVQCAQRLHQFDKGYLITCICDLQVMIMCTISTGQVIQGNSSIDSKFFLTMIEPVVEYLMKCVLKDVKQTDIGNMLVALEMGTGKNLSAPFQNHSGISIVLHHMLRELPTGYICSNAVELLNLIECTNDYSFDQCLNFKLLGIRLSEKIPEVNNAHLVVDVIAKALASSAELDEYVMIADAYLDIILENHLDTYTSVLLFGIFERVQVEKISENELVTLQSIFCKLISHFGNIEKILELNHFVDILDTLHGSSRNTISVHLLITATRNGPIRDTTVIDILFQVAQALYDNVDFSNMRKDDYQHPGRAITHFVLMVDYRREFENQLRFLCQCRGAFPDINELQEMLVHSSNNLAARAMRDGNSNTRIVRSCLAYNEVTIPSIPSNLRQLNLYLEAAEIAILGGFFSHIDGLMDAAVSCVQHVDLNNGLWMPEDANEIISIICKLCGLSLMVPGSFCRSVLSIPKRLLSFVDSKSWILPGMKIKVLSAVIFVFSALVQEQLPHHIVSQEVICNYQLFFGLPSYLQEILSLSGVVLGCFVDTILQEPSVAVRGKIALEVCNCVASVFMKSDEALEACSKLVEIARSCLSPDDKFLQSTLKFLDTRLFQL